MANRAIDSEKTTQSSTQIATLRLELESLFTSDQSAVRDQIRGAELVKENVRTLSQLIDTLGWPLLSQVGPRASSAAFLIAQHADHDPVFQVRCLEMMKRVPSGEIELSHLAYLEDRILCNQGRPQLFGTQGSFVGQNWVVSPLYEADGVDQRRLEYGLEPLAVYSHQIAPAAPLRNFVVGVQPVTVFADAKTTGGKYSLCEVEHPAGRGAPFHLHRFEIEHFWIVQGNYEFALGDLGTRLLRTPGQHLYAPIGIPHQFKVLGPESGKMILYFTPAGFDQYFERMSRLDADLSRHNTAYDDLDREFGVEICKFPT